MKTIGVLTSSRADYGIYLPLLKKIESSQDLQLKLIVFGTHLSSFHGMTVDAIISDGFQIGYRVNSMLLHDDQNAISSAASLTMLKFADFWQAHQNKFDLVFCLGDRYEMFGAVYAGVPFGIRFAHIHGGETTLGAVDNVYRHAITHASSIHFTSIEAYKKRVYELTHSDDIYVTGSLSLDSLIQMSLYDFQEMSSIFKVDFSRPTILVTVHPETVGSERNEYFAGVCYEAFSRLTSDYQLVITMPNADTLGSIYRNTFEELKENISDRVILIESFGTRGYFSAMKYCKFLIGNTSSGIIEASSFGKYVINLGDRQLGRIAGDNVVHAPFKVDEIRFSVEKVKKLGQFKGSNLYDLGGASEKILNVVNQMFLKFSDTKS